eukprot:GSMAST32.ASY1.ANO1.1333.1 assembled CDS
MFPVHTCRRFFSSPAVRERSVDFGDIVRASSYFREQAFIGGTWVDSTSGNSFDVVDPASDEYIGSVPDMNANDTDIAIRAAEHALPSWSRKLAKERSAILEKWHDLMLQNKDELAQIMTLESGKPLAESIGEEAKRAYGDIIPEPLSGRKLLTVKEPVGVSAPALAAGSCAAIAEEAGLPPGLFNIVTSSRKNTPEVGEVLTNSKIVKKFSFTGSTKTGKILAKQCANTVKRVSLELGGNAPFIVFDDADIDAAIQGVINTGQTCVCANRIYVHDTIYDEFADLLTQKVKSMPVGPLINKSALEKVEDHVSNAVKLGAKVLTGGDKHIAGDNFYIPTVLSEVNQNMKIANEETFGPVAPLFRFSNEEEVITAANNVDSGLAAYLYSRDIGRVFRVSQALEYGMVGANAGVISSEVAPFGGVKESGLGREGGNIGMDEFMEVKYICLGGL